MFSHIAFLKLGKAPVFPALVVLIFLVPVSAGLLGSLIPALGYFPVLGKEDIGLEIWDQFWAYPGTGQAVWLSFYVGMAATALSFVITNLFCATFYQTRYLNWLRRALGPLLSLPHVSLSIGLLFLLAPSGWLFRLISPDLTGLERPLDIAIFPDFYGLSLLLALIVKEVPFLLLMQMSALNEMPTERNLRVCEALGYGKYAGWIKVILPQIYKRVRLPVLAVLVFSVSVVDMSLILLPGTAPNLGMLVLRWYGDGDLSFQFLAAMGATMQAALAFGAVVSWVALEKVCHRLLRWQIATGKRFFGSETLELILSKLAAVKAGILVCLGFSSILLLLLWSFAGRWRFPDTLPSVWSLRYWDRHLDNLMTVVGTSVSLAVISSALALVLVIGCLENLENLSQRVVKTMQGLIYLPLLVPQIAFLFGVQFLSVWTNLDGGYFVVIWGHILFVLPYVFLSLSGPYMSLDKRYIYIAQSLGYSKAHILLKVKLPLLLRSLFIAFAIGFAVSNAQYLATFFLGAGRIETLTTEAVALTSGGDRRVIGIYAFLQSALPFVAFAFATLIPGWLYRHKRGMKGAA